MFVTAITSSGPFIGNADIIEPGKPSKVKLICSSGFPHSLQKVELSSIFFPQYLQYIVINLFSELLILKLLSSHLGYIPHYIVKEVLNYQNQSHINFLSIFWWDGFR